MVTNRFKLAFRGYDRDEVEAYICQTERMNEQLMHEQKERIFQLVEEVEGLNNELDKYRLDEQAISKSLIDSQKLALQMRDNADNYSQVVLARAKLFYATWSSYAKTLMNGLNDQEVRQFNALSQKIAEVIENFGDDSDCNNVVATTAVGGMVNPIDKVQKASNYSIDPKEILSPKDSLEDICKDLGLIK